MKKALMIGLMAVMICLVAGCGAKKEEEGKTNNYGINSETEESSGTAEKAPLMRSKRMNLCCG